MKVTFLPEEGISKYGATKDEYNIDVDLEILLSGSSRGRGYKQM